MATNFHEPFWIIALWPGLPPCLIRNEADDTSVNQTYTVTRIRAYKDKYCDKICQTRLLCNEVSITKLVKVMQSATARTLQGQTIF